MRTCKRIQELFHNLLTVRPRKWFAIINLFNEVIQSHSKVLEDENMTSVSYKTVLQVHKALGTNKVNALYQML